MRLLALLFVFLTFNVWADDLVVRDAAGNVVSLHEAPCTSFAWLKEWKTATFKYEGKSYKACWRLVGSSVVVLDSIGDVTPIPAAAFTKETGV